MSNDENDFVSRSVPIVDIYAKALTNLANPTPGVTLKDFPKFNTLTGGFRPREFSILCGATGIGKTTLLANLSKQLIEENTKHLVMSVETGPTDFIQRVMSVFSGRDFNTGDSVPKQDLKDFHRDHGVHFQKESCFLSLYEDRVPMDLLKQDLLYHSQVLGCKVAFIDNLNFFMEVSRSSDTNLEMDKVVHGLVILAKQIDMHIIMVMHPKKTENGRVESEFDIKGSSTAVQEAHNVFLFNRPKKEWVESGIVRESDRELYFAKLRKRGKSVGSRIIYRNFNSKYIEGDVHGNKI